MTTHRGFEVMDQGSNTYTGSVPAAPEAPRPRSRGSEWIEFACRHREGAPGPGVRAAARGQPRLAVELPGALGQGGGAAVPAARRPGQDAEVSSRRPGPRQAGAGGRPAQPLQPAASHLQRRSPVSPLAPLSGVSPIAPLPGATWRRSRITTSKTPDGIPP